MAAGGGPHASRRGLGRWRCAHCGAFGLLCYTGLDTGRKHGDTIRGRNGSRRARGAPRGLLSLTLAPVTLALHALVARTSERGRKKFGGIYNEHDSHQYTASRSDTRALCTDVRTAVRTEPEEERVRWLGVGTDLSLD